MRHSQMKIWELDNSSKNKDGKKEKKENLGKFGEIKWYCILLMMMKNLQEKDIII